MNQIDFLKQLVSVSSDTADKAGVSKVQQLTAERLRQLGFKTRTIKNPTPTIHSADLLVAELKGSENTSIDFMTHADTVYPAKDAVAPTVNGNTMRGSGTIDCKGGTVVALTGIEKYLAQHRPKHTLRFISAPSEEFGSPGFIELFKSFAVTSYLGLGFEPSLDNGSIVKSRRGNLWYHVQVMGKEAHSGRNHRDGVNAALDLSLKIAELHKLTDYSKNISINTGHIEGGKDKYNVVCGWATAKIEARFADFKSSTRLQKQMEKIFAKPYVKSSAKKVPTKTTFSIQNDCPPLAENQLSRPYLQKYLQLIKKIEKRTARAEAAGGASDLNYFSSEKAILIDGLGATGGGMHTLDEFIHLPSLQTRSQVLAEFLDWVEAK